MYLSTYLSFFHVARAGFELCSSSLYLLSPEITLAGGAPQEFSQPQCPRPSNWGFSGFQSVLAKGSMLLGSLDKRN